MGGEDGLAALDRHQPVMLLLLLARMRLGLAEDGLHAEQDAAGFGRPAESRHALLDVGEIGPGVLRPRLDGEHGVGVAGGEVAPAGRGAGLEDRRAVLRRAHHVERPARAEELAFMLDPVHLRGVGEARALAVEQHGVLVPAVPELAADLHVFVGALVAALRRLALDAVIGGLVAVDGGHHVPPGPAGGHVVERGPEARGVEGVLVGDREGRRDPDALRHRAEPAEQRHRVVLGRLHGVAQRRLQRALVGIRDVVEVGEEHHVEQAALAGARDMLVEARPRPVP